MVFVDDHPPAHIHAIAPDGDAKIELGSATQDPTLVRIRGPMGGADVRRAVAEVTRHRSAMRAAWDRIHGTKP